MAGNFFEDELSSHSDLDWKPSRGHHARKVQVKPSVPEYPKSCYDDWVPPLPVTPEHKAVQDLRAEQHRVRQYMPNGKKPMLILDLEDFSIYRPQPDPSRRKKGDWELVGLQTEINSNGLLLDGILSYGSVKRYVQRVRFEFLSLEGFGDKDVVFARIYIQTTYCTEVKDCDIWFRLGRPSSDYSAFFSPFSWIASFTKHFVDYLSIKPARSIHLSHFELQFHEWLQEQYTGRREFETWLAAFDRKVDFRLAVNAYIDFMFRQAYNLSNSQHVLSHWVWSDCLRWGSTITDERKVNRKDGKRSPTITTPFVKEAFKNMYFAGYLQELSHAPPVLKETALRSERMGFAKCSQSLASNPATKPAIRINARHSTLNDLKMGDVIGIKRDEQGDWQTSDAEWLAWIRRVEPTSKGDKRLYVIWLYKSADTTISTMYYPIPKELFFSDNCNCAEAPLMTSHVVGKYTVDWNPRNLHTTKDFLIRQKYATVDNAFITLRDSDFQCHHERGASAQIKYHVGDCVYIRKTRRIQTPRGVTARTVLEPVVLNQFHKFTDEVTVRRLLRVGRDGSSLKTVSRRTNICVNELAWTADFEKIPVRSLKRKCRVRFFTVDQISSRQVPAPYNRGGAGDCWIISTMLATCSEERRLEPLTTPFPGPLNEGFDPSTPPVYAPLRGLSIFSGGGNFDRGLEEGAAVHLHGAVDISQEAIHTQSANAKHKDRFHPYFGSVDDYLALVLKESSATRTATNVARIGDVEFIAAGSPCQGYSTLQVNPNSDASLSNASHVTSFCSFVDVFRPHYAILENVANIAAARKGQEDEKVLSQVIACLVAMGYQTQQFLMDAWSHGSDQRRTRLFIAIAAPGLEPWAQPMLTHTHPEETPAKSLGRLSNGEKFGAREDYPTPFEYKSAGQATSDLPDIGTSVVQACISYPDHVLSTTLNARDRAIVKHIPINPPGQSYATAMAAGLLPPSLQVQRSEVGRAWRRMKSSTLFPTITTVARPQDSRCGDILHWSQHRPMTVQEARRAQGVPDNEVIIGTPREQYAIIGNGVDRYLALALGLSLRRAWTVSYHRIMKNSVQENRWDALIDSSEDELSPSKAHPQDVTHRVVAMKTLVTTKKLKDEDRHVATGVMGGSNPAPVSQAYKNAFERFRYDRPAHHRTADLSRMSETSSEALNPDPLAVARLSITDSARSKRKIGIEADEGYPSTQKTPEPIKKRTRHEGPAELGPTDWSKIPGFRYPSIRPRRILERF